MPTDTNKETVAKILKLKKTASSINGAPMGYREIGAKLGMTGMGVNKHVKHILKGRCPSCLQRLTKPELKP